MSIELKEGFQKDIPNEAYHDNRTHISSSALKLFIDNPKLYFKKYELGEEEEEADKAQGAYDFGSYIHTRVLEPHLLDVEYAIYEGKTRRGKVYEDFCQKNEGKIIISRSQVEMADKMMSAYENSGVEIGRHGYHTEVPYTNFFQQGDAELTACTDLMEVPVKVRFDYYKSTSKFASINDVKTTSIASLTQEAVQEACNKYGYHISAAMYVDVATALTGKKHDFYFLFMSKKAPYDVKLFRASEEMLERGREEYQMGLQKLKEARETGIWWESKIEELY
jgi:exodeoxyribonuclease VIII